jgi:hypothetical protein
MYIFDKTEVFMPSRARLFVFLLMLSLPGTAFCQSDLPATLKALLKERIDAISKKDTTALNRICTKNYQFISAAGVQMSIMEMKKAVVDAETPVKLSTILSYQPYIAEDESMAFATFEIEEEVAQDSRNITKNDLIITEIYKKEKGRWKIQLTHASQKICLLSN